jgi:hypothetical protein
LILLRLDLFLLSFISNDDGSGFVL